MISHFFLQDVNYIKKNLIKTHKKSLFCKCTIRRIYLINLGPIIPNMPVIRFHCKFQYHCFSIWVITYQIKELR